MTIKGSTYTSKLSERGLLHKCETVVLTTVDTRRRLPPSLSFDRRFGQSTRPQAHTRKGSRLESLSLHFTDSH
jgi:hypothetical protein